LHVRVARTYLGKAKVSSATKASIAACVTRKAKALGCGGGDNKETVESEQKISNEIKISNFTCEIIGKLSNDELLTGSKWVEAELETRGLNVKKVEDISKETVAKNEELTAKIKGFEDQLKALRSELKDLYSDCSDLEDSKIELLEQLHKERARRLCDLQILSGEIKHQGELEQKLEIEVAKASDVVAQNLKDIEVKINLYEIVERLNNGMTRKPEGTVDDPTLSNDNKKPKDNDFTRIRNHYQHLLKNSGQLDADSYLDLVKRSGLVPKDFKINA
jgi:hypothetical protein